MPEQYILILNFFQKELLDHAINYCIDSQHNMGAITPAIADDLRKIQKSIQKGGDDIEIRYKRRKSVQKGSGDNGMFRNGFKDFFTI